MIWTSATTKPEDVMMRWGQRLAVFALLCLAGSARSGDWEAVTTDLVKAEKPGYGGLCGMVVDHSTGDLFVNLSDKGLYRSTDQGKTWKKDGPVVKGRTEWPGCLLFDPTAKSKRMLMALVYGAPVSISADADANWKHLDGKSEHVDWCVADWTDPDLKFLLALKHESGGLLILSRDGGKSFTEVGKGHGPAWIFDKDTAVVAEMKTKERATPHLLRTTDGGKTWEPCGEYAATALPKWFDGTLYWLVDGALLATTDSGKTWKKLGEIKDGRYGPIFGKDAKQLFVLTKDGIIESTDGGASWSKPLAIPKELKGVSPLTWIEYDPKNDVLYVMKMTSDLYRMARGR
jgi:BNR/Asp-box repeat